MVFAGTAKGKPRVAARICKRKAPGCSPGLFYVSELVLSWQNFPAELRVRILLYHLKTLTPENLLIHNRFLRDHGCHLAGHIPMRSQKRAQTPVAQLSHEPERQAHVAGIRVDHRDFPECSARNPTTPRSPNLLRILVTRQSKTANSTSFRLRSS